MSLLARIKQGRQVKPQIHTIFGLPGVGKTTWASKFPNPIIFDIEKGSSHLDVTRIEEFEGFEGFRNDLKNLLTDTHDYKTIVLDSIEAFESMMSEHVCAEGGVTSIDDYAGGYGKGYTRIREMMREVMSLLRQLTEKRGMTAVLIGHSQVKQHNDPAENVSYDRYIMRCNDKMAAIIRDLSDNVFFACHKVFTTKEGQKVHAISNGQRIIKTTWTAAYDAKNRLNLPEEIQLSYDAFIKAIEDAKPKTTDELKKEIEAMLPGLDKETRPKAEEAFKKATTVEELNAIKNRVHTLVAA